jgi:hypothetical protein
MLTYADVCRYVLLGGPMTDALAFPWHAGSGQQGMESVFEVVSREFDRSRGPMPDSFLRDPSTNYGIYNFSISVYVCMHASMHIYILYMYTRMYRAIHTHTHTHTHKYTRLELLVYAALS